MAECEECGGVIVDKAALRQAAGGDDVVKIWRRIHLGRPAGLDCPMCGKVMEATRVDGVELDGCPDEEVVWFDSLELTRFRTGLAPADVSRLADDSFPIPVGRFWIAIWPF